MNNNNENILDVDELFKITSNLKKFKEEIISTMKILSKAPSRNIRERYSNAKIEYLNTLSELDAFIRDYIKVNPEIIKEEN